MLLGDGCFFATRVQQKPAQYILSALSWALRIYGLKYFTAAGKLSTDYPVDAPSLCGCLNAVITVATFSLQSVNGCSP